jgi:hypothetical protein
MKLEDYLDDYLKELNGSGGQIIKEELGEAFFNRAVVHLRSRGQHFMDDEGRFFDMARMEKAMEGPSYQIPSGQSFEEFDQWMRDCAEGKIKPIQEND